jgi:hypothetical protein
MKSDEETPKQVKDDGKTIEGEVKEKSIPRLRLPFMLE